jgi:hypothetical protein
MKNISCSYGNVKKSGSSRLVYLEALDAPAESIAEGAELGNERLKAMMGELDGIYKDLADHQKALFMDDMQELAGELGSLQGELDTERVKLIGPAAIETGILSLSIAAGDTPDSIAAKIVEVRKKARKHMLFEWLESGNYDTSTYLNSHGTKDLEKIVHSAAAYLNSTGSEAFYASSEGVDQFQAMFQAALNHYATVPFTSVDEYVDGGSSAHKATADGFIGKEQERVVDEVAAEIRRSVVAPLQEVGTWTELRFVSGDNASELVDGVMSVPEAYKAVFINGLPSQFDFSDATIARGKNNRVYLQKPQADGTLVYYELGEEKWMLKGVVPAIAREVAEVDKAWRAEQRDKMATLSDSQERLEYAVETEFFGTSYEIGKDLFRRGLSFHSFSAEFASASTDLDGLSVEKEQYEPLLRSYFEQMVAEANTRYRALNKDEQDSLTRGEKVRMKYETDTNGNAHLVLEPVLAEGQEVVGSAVTKIMETLKKQFPFLSFLPDVSEGLGKIFDFLHKGLGSTIQQYAPGVATMIEETGSKIGLTPDQIWGGGVEGEQARREAEALNNPPFYYMLQGSRLDSIASSKAEKQYLAKRPFKLSEGLDIDADSKIEVTLKKGAKILLPAAEDGAAYFTVPSGSTAPQAGVLYHHVDPSPLTITLTPGSRLLQGTLFDSSAVENGIRFEKKDKDGS